MIKLNKKKLLNQIFKNKKEYMKLRFKKEKGCLKDTCMIKIVKKNIAKIMTKLNNKI